MFKLLKNGGFIWKKEAEEAFEKLKMTMSTTPVLALPNWSKVFFVKTDASDMGVGAALMQDQQPIAYLSKVLGPRQQKMSVHEKELMALAITVNKWRHYLEGSHFIKRTDHQSLKQLVEQRVTTAHINGLQSC